jgi:hypothetical protein
LPARNGQLNRYVGSDSPHSCAKQQATCAPWPAKQRLTIMIILGLFLIHLLETAAAFVFIERLVRWLGGATMTESALMFAAVIGAVATLLVLITHRRGGVIVAVAVIAFWSLAIFGASGPAAVNVIVIAFAALAVAAALVVAESMMGRRRVARRPP